MNKNLSDEKVKHVIFLIASSTKFTMDDVNMFFFYAVQLFSSECVKPNNLSESQLIGINNHLSNNQYHMLDNK